MVWREKFKNLSKFEGPKGILRPLSGCHKTKAGVRGRLWFWGHEFKRLPEKAREFGRNAKTVNLPGFFGKGAGFAPSRGGTRPASRVREPRGSFGAKAHGLPARSVQIISEIFEIWIFFRKFNKPFMIWQTLFGIYLRS